MSFKTYFYSSCSFADTSFIHLDIAMAHFKSVLGLIFNFQILYFSEFRLSLDHSKLYKIYISVVYALSLYLSSSDALILHLKYVNWAQM